EKTDELGKITMASSSGTKDFTGSQPQPKGKARISRQVLTRELQTDCNQWNVTASPVQTATGKDKSSPFMVNTLPKGVTAVQTATSPGLTGASPAQT
ncbi:hypothetical protein KI387_012373, partial [Taxus chinensis]